MPTHHAIGVSARNGKCEPEAQATQEAASIGRDEVAHDHAVQARHQDGQVGTQHEKGSVQCQQKHLLGLGIRNQDAQNRTDKMQSQRMLRGVAWPQGLRGTEAMSTLMQCTATYLNVIEVPSYQPLHSACTYCSCLKNSLFTPTRLAAAAAWPPSALTALASANLFSFAPLPAAACASLPSSVGGGTAKKG